MDKREMLDMPHVGVQDVATDEESTPRHQNAALGRQVAALREDNEDLRASALWWKALYEAAQRRCSDLEGSAKTRTSTHVDPHFTMTSSPRARASHRVAITRPL
jgi:hypothetical protein